MIFNFLADHLFSKLRCCSEVMNDRGYKEACHLKLNTNMIKHKQDFPSDLSEFALSKILFKLNDHKYKEIKQGNYLKQTKPKKQTLASRWQANQICTVPACSEHVDGKDIK